MAKYINKSLTEIISEYPYLTRPDNGLEVGKDYLITLGYSGEWILGKINFIYTDQKFGKDPVDKVIIDPIIWTNNPYYCNDPIYKDGRIELPKEWIK